MDAFEQDAPGGHLFQGDQAETSAIQSRRWMGREEAERLCARIEHEGQRFALQVKAIPGLRQGTWVVETTWDNVLARHATPAEWEEYFAKTNTWKEECLQQSRSLMLQWELHKKGGGRPARPVSSLDSKAPVRQRRSAPPLPAPSPGFFRVASLARTSVARLAGRVQPSQPGEPALEADVCPLCKGAGHGRADVPFGHPSFGKPVPCQCVLEKRREKRFGEMLAQCQRAGFERTKTLKSFRFQVPGVAEAYLATKQFIGRLEEWAVAREGALGEGVAPDPLPDYWLILAGTPGVGKSHLLMSIGNASLDEDIPTIFSPVPDLLDYLRATFDPQNGASYDAFFDLLKNVEVLLLDDFGAQHTTPWVTEKLYQLLNYRYVQRLPTAITLNSHIWQYLDTRLLSRFRDASLVELIVLDEAEDYRPRQGKVVLSESTEL